MSVSVWFRSCFSGHGASKEVEDPEEAELQQISFAFNKSLMPTGGQSVGRLQTRSNCDQSITFLAGRTLGAKTDCPAGNEFTTFGPAKDCLADFGTADHSRQLKHSATSGLTCSTTMHWQASSELLTKDDQFSSIILASLKPVNAPIPHAFKRTVATSDLNDFPFDEPSTPAHRHLSPPSSNVFHVEVVPWASDFLVPLPCTNSSDDHASCDNNGVDAHTVPVVQRSWGSARST